MSEIKDTIKNFCEYWHEDRRMLTEADYKYLMSSPNTEDPFSYYCMPKMHKTPPTMRPICSTSGSTSYGLGKWTDKEMKPLHDQLPNYLKSSKLPEELQALPRETACELAGRTRRGLVASSALHSRRCFDVHQYWHRTCSERD